jgi:hypothetical protein
MIICKTLLIFLVLLLSHPLFAQMKRPVADYTKADELALTVKSDDDINKLTTDLTSAFTEQTLKARAIFRWITDNIAYDYKFFNKYYIGGKDPKSFSCQGDSIGCSIKKVAWENDIVNNTLNDKKGVCQGYSLLFKKMCNIAGIDAEFVPGYARTDPYQIGTPGNLSHAWNMVRLNGVSYLLDATWAAGGCRPDENGKLISFEKNYKDYYWLTPADEFARNHFPLNAKWVLLPNYTIAMFALNPYYPPAEISNIKLIAPASGVIAAKKGDTIRFRINYLNTVNKVLINSNVFKNPDIWIYTENNNHQRIRMPDSMAIKRQQYIPYQRNGNSYTFNYVVKDYTLDYLDILFDNRQVMRFKVKVAR